MIVNQLPPMSPQREFGSLGVCRSYRPLMVGLRAGCVRYLGAREEPAQAWVLEELVSVLFIRARIRDHPMIPQETIATRTSIKT